MEAYKKIFMRADGPPTQGEDSVRIETPNENIKAVDWCP